MPKHDWNKYFPYSSVRPEQKNAIDSILDSFESGKRFFILNAATGVGKSAIAVTVARYIENHFERGEEVQPGSNILTTQKLLQEQYKRDYSEINSLKSSSNYQCQFHKKETCCSSRKMLQVADRSSAFWKACAFNCTYAKEKKKFIEENHGVTNFSYFLTETRYSKKLPKKSLLVIDEAHNAPDVLSKFIEVTFSDKFAKAFVGLDLPEVITPVAFVKWIKDVYYPKLDEKTQAFEAGLQKFANVKDRIESGELAKLSNQLEILSGHVQKVLTFIALYDKENWIISEIPAEDRSGRKVEFKPIDIAPYANEYLFRMSDYVLLMSATIVDCDRFAELCGINDAKSRGTLSINSPFPVENRPIIYSGIGKMTMNEIDSTLPKLAEAVKAILREHKNEKGVIHAHSYKIVDYLRRNVKDSRLLFHNSENRDEVLRQHISSTKPTVLLSPSMTEGVDLKDDLSRFQILCKVPYPYLGDKLNRKKMSKWPWWLDIMTATTVIQSTGRSVRNEKDTAVTYILDSSWQDFFKKNRHYFGPEFQSTI